MQNVPLLAGMAPTCYMEQLIYDCRLMNRALAEGKPTALALRSWLVDSDAALDPQAWALTPESVIAIAQRHADRVPVAEMWIDRAIARSIAPDSRDSNDLAGFLGLDRHG